MQHRKVREIVRDGKPSGLFHYTTTLGGGVVPFGACMDDCPGHSTPEEAYEHERQRLLSEASETEPGGWRDCAAKGCTEPANRGYRWGRMGEVSLCDEHRTLRELDRHVFVGESWVS